MDRSTMLVWAALVTMAAAEKAVVWLDPPWTTIFQGENVTLTCHVPEDYCEWYRGRSKLQAVVTEITAIVEEKHSGKYTCKSKNSETSDPVKLTVSKDWVILQVPYSAVFEGDELRMNCLGWRTYYVKTVWYYKNSQLITTFTKQQTLIIQNVKRNDSDTYSCSVELKKAVLPYIYHSNDMPIEVQELFPSPILTVTPSQLLVEGQKMTLVCNTKLSPQKSNTKLQFFFYKDWNILEEPSRSPEIDVTAVRLEDSGLYKCAVQTVNHNVWKESSLLKINVQRIPVSGISLKVLPQSRELVEGEALMMTCSVDAGTGNIIFSWCKLEAAGCMKKEMPNRKEAEHTIPEMTEEDSGSYYCTASNDIAGGPITSSAVRIDVKLRVSQPLLTLKVDGDRALIGESVDIQCESQRGSLPIKYQFYHQQTYLGTVIINARRPGSHTITASEESLGAYHCDANNGIPSGIQESEAVNLTVIVPVSGASLRMAKASSEVQVGENLTFICSLELGSSPEFHWLHNEKEATVVSGMYQLITPGKVLHIEYVQPDHGGSYQCQARNQLNQERIFNSTSNILSIKVLEVGVPNSLVATFASLVIIIALAVTAILGFLEVKCQKKTDDSYINAPVSNHQIPEQPAPGSRQESFLVEQEQQYDNMPAMGSATPGDRTEADLVYAVIDTKAKQKAQTASPQETEYCVTYSTLKNDDGDAAAGWRESDRGEAYESLENIYQNFQHK